MLSTKAGQAELASRGIVAPLGLGIRLHPETAVEGPLQVTKTVRWDTPVKLGAFSMLHGAGDIVAASIGRYCSMAPGVVIGSNEHAMEWLTTSSLLENPRIYGWNDVVPGAPAASTLTENWFKASIKPITIGNDVWIGQNAFVKGGVTIGDGAVVGAMSNVVADVPPYAIVAGNPARLIRYRFDHHAIVRLLAVKWWRFSLFDLLGHDLTDLRCLDEIEAAEKAGALREYRPDVLTAEQLSSA